VQYILITIRRVWRRRELGKTKVMKCEAKLNQQKTHKSGRVEFAGKVLVQIVLSAINAVSGFMKSVSGKL